MSVVFNKSEILARFQEMLDTVAEGEKPPSGIDAALLDALRSGHDAAAPDPVDAYKLWSAMTALTQEVKLQGRAFQELSLGLNAQSTRVADEVRATCKENERESVRIAQRETERRCQKQTLQILIDLYDGMSRALETVRTAQETVADAPPPSFLQRMFSPPPDTKAAEVLRALTDGYELSMERISHTLAELHAHEIHCEGQFFDPRRMNAVDAEESSSVPEGTVLEVYRSGFEWNDEILRPAQVRVARAPSIGGKI